MAQQDKKSLRYCPFWSALSMKCRVSGGGLFIPLDDHVDIFCRGAEHYQCLQYVMHTENLSKLQAESESLGENRRHFPRIGATHQLTLVRLVESGETVAHSKIPARTLDMSLGGLRVYTDTPLANETMVQISFDPSLPSHIRGGVGQVAWCNKQIDETGYQAGVAFRDSRLIQAMGRYLEKGAA